MLSIPANLAHFILLKGRSERFKSVLYLEILSNKPLELQNPLKECILKTEAPFFNWSFFASF